MLASFADAVEGLIPLVCARHKPTPVVATDIAIRTELILFLERNTIRMASGSE
jgi:hypothetical protein